MFKYILLFSLLPTIVFAQTTQPGTVAAQKQAQNSNIQAQNSSTNASLNNQAKPNVILPPFGAIPQNCGEIGSTSFGSPNFGGSIYLPHDNDACDRRLDTIILMAMGHDKAALYRMCQNKNDANALNQENPNTCPYSFTKHKMFGIW